MAQAVTLNTIISQRGWPQIVQQQNSFIQKQQKLQSSWQDSYELPLDSRPTSPYIFFGGLLNKEHSLLLPLRWWSNSTSHLDARHVRLMVFWLYRHRKSLSASWPHFKIGFLYRGFHISSLWSRSFCEDIHSLESGLSQIKRPLLPYIVDAMHYID